MHEIQAHKDQSVVLSVRPPISLPQTTVPPAILDELISEISSLASVYHKPAATFIGKGRLGAEEMAKRNVEYVSDDYQLARHMLTFQAGRGDIT